MGCGSGYVGLPGAMFKNWGDKNVHDIERDESNGLFHRRIRSGVACLILYHQGKVKAVAKTNVVYHRSLSCSRDLGKRRLLAEALDGN